MARSHRRQFLAHACARRGELASLGIATPLAVPLAVHGTAVIVTAGKNLIKGSPPPKDNSGSYTNTHKSGKTYSGKGNQERAKESGNRVAKENKDPVKKSEWKPAKNAREAFKAEDKRIQKNGGAGNNEKNYNKINSPGKKYNQQDNP